MTATPPPRPLRMIVGILGLSVLPVFGQWGAIDPTFIPGGGRNSGFDNDVFSIGVQPDGKLLVTGFFQNFDRSSRSGVARLLPGGGLDSAFDPGAGATTPNDLPHTVEAQVLLPDGRVIVGGRFLAFDGVAQPYLARLNASGSLDANYAPALGGLVVAMALQADGRLLIGGTFQTVNGAPRTRVTRLRGDGSLDPLFTADGGPDRSVSAIALQPDGRILVAGSFTNYTGVPRARIARLHPDGRLDMQFNPGTGANQPVLAVSVQPNGKILIGGEFTEFDGVPRNYVARLHENGSLDSAFTPDFGLVFGGVLAVRRAPDGKVLVGGEFTTVDGETRINLVRLNPDGRLDPTFDTGAGPEGGFDPRVRWIELQADGKVLVGGGFTRFDGVDLNYIARLTGDQGGSLRFARAGYEANENDGNAIITVERTGSTNGAMIVNYATTGGTATPNADYLAQNGAVTFAPGETQQTFAVPILSDNLVEGDESVMITLGNPLGGAILGSPQSVLLTILDQTNAAPQLIIQSITHTNTDVTITWASMAGLSYQVEFKTNLTDATWGILDGNVSASGPAATKVDTALQDRERFYRVRQLP